MIHYLLNVKRELMELIPIAGSNAKVVCYYTSWSSRRPGIGRFSPEDIDVSLCTHLIFAFGSLKNNRLSILAPSSDANDGDEVYDDPRTLSETHERLQDLRAKNEDLKIILAVGGWALGPTPFKDLTSNVFRMNQFVYDSTEFLRANKFDGLDVDWAYPR